MDYIEAMRHRHSVRTYIDKPISAEQREALLIAIDELETPFGGRVKIVLAEKNGESSFKPSTYGVITGAKCYLLLYVDDDVLSLLSGGYALEMVVLKATMLGLGTCWLGGTFSASSFKTAENAPNGMKLVIVCPVGIPASKQSLLHKITEAIARSHSRKPMDKLFGQGGFDKRVAETSPFYEPLEMMRLAPSSVNSQPWRALVFDDETVQFFTTSQKSLNLIDMGIGLCHFAIAANMKNKRGHFSISSLKKVDSPAGLHYVVSYS